jgi:dienelactone hydrolase
MQPLPSVSEAPIGQIVYPSANPFEIHHILCALDAAPDQSVFGSLLVPERPAREPLACVVACHGSLGWRGHHHEHMVRWLESGIAVFRVHSFDARSVVSIVEDQMAVTHAMLLTDAYQALALLGRHPLIDADRIGVSGWSLGGTVALYAAWSPIAEALAPGGERFAAHLPLYPAAHMRPEEKRWTGAPIRVLHGADDDYTPVQFVTDLADELRPHGVEIDVRAYPGGHHSFDSVDPMVWLPHAIRLGRRTTTIDTKGDMWVELKDGERKSLNEPGERLAGFKAAANVGAHIGGHWEARRQGLADSEAFFRETLLGGQTDA